MKNLLLIIFAGLIFLYLNAYANGNYRNSHDHDGVDGVDGIDGKPGLDGIVNYSNVSSLDLELSGAVASAAAMAMIPAIPHKEDNHGHTGIGIGMAEYNGAEAIALGVVYQENNVTGQFSMSVSTGAGPIVGTGVLWGF